MQHEMEHWHYSIQRDATVPLSIASTDEKLRHSEKPSFRKYIIKESELLNTIPPEDAARFIDGMALISCLIP